MHLIIAMVLAKDDCNRTFDGSTNLFLARIGPSFALRAFAIFVRDMLISTNYATDLCLIYPLRRPIDGGFSSVVPTAHLAQTVPFFRN